MTYEKLLKVAYQKIDQVIDKEHEAAKLLLLELSGLDPHQFYLNIKTQIDQTFVDKYLTMLDQYLYQDIPVQHLIGHSYFFGYPFIVNDKVLIPRQETEQLVEEVLYLYDKHFENQEIKVLDLGTGSGCIGLTLALEEKNMDVTLSDISEEALKVAEKNQEKLSAKANLVLSDLFHQIEGTFDIIVSNPPYIPDEEDVQNIVKKEPNVALYGGKLGVDFYEKILLASKSHIKSKALIAFEHGYQQKEKIKQFIQNIYPNASIFQKKDLQGKDRFTFIGIGINL